jgi:hypothetical protein
MDRFIDARHPPPRSPPWIMLLRDRIHQASNHAAPFLSPPPPIQIAWIDAMGDDFYRFAPVTKLLRVLQYLFAFERMKCPQEFTPYIDGPVSAIDSLASHILYMHQFIGTWMAPMDIMLNAYRPQSWQHRGMDGSGHASRWATILADVRRSLNRIWCAVKECRLSREYMKKTGRSLIRITPMVIQTATHILHLARVYWDDTAAFACRLNPREVAISHLEQGIDLLGFEIGCIGERCQS